MPQNKKNVPIKYTSREFQSIKNDLVEYTKRYYPDTFKDFNEASFGAMMLDMVAYVGDILSFYLDYQANESFLDTAIEYDNVIKLGHQLGYKFRGNPSSYGTANFYVLVPAKTSGLGPNYDYAPILLKGTQVGTPAGNSFLLNENVDFSDTDHEVVVAKVNESTGLPTSYAIKASGLVISGKLFEDTITIGEFQKFRKIRLAGKNIAEVISVFDSEGHEYLEVDYLSQNVIMKAIPNSDSNRLTVPYLLKSFVVPRRFVVEQTKKEFFLQFGYGSESEISENKILDPSRVVLKIYGKDHISDDTFDPSKLLQTDKFGVAPSNTVLRIIYRTNSRTNANIGAETLTRIIKPRFKFRNTNSLTTSTKRTVVNSLECSNEIPIVGDVSLPSTNELKRRIFDNFASQGRAVTKQDYINLIYSMPPKFGAIKRANIAQDHDSFKRNLNLYVVSESSAGLLAETNSTIKNNLKSWLNRYKMINDTIDILNARIVNIGIKFLIVAERSTNKFDVLSSASAVLRNELELVRDIGEPFYITDIYKILNDVDGVVDTVNVEIESKFGGAYSDTAFNIQENISLDGRQITTSEDIVIEIRFPKSDIQGAVS